MPSKMRAVPGVEHTFVSLDGDVFSDVASQRWGSGLRKLKPTDNGRGYLRVRCQGKARCIHLLVAEAFIGPRPPGLEVNHKDGDKRNNRPENLEYVTRAENMRHCFQMGLANPPTGERHPMATLSRAQVAKLRHDYVMLRDGRDRMPNGAMRHLQQKYAITDTCINSIVRGLTWR